MSDLFISILNLSISTSYLIAAVLIFRLLLKRAPKYLSCILWAFAAFRLVCPVSFENVLSLIPSRQTVSPDIVYSASPAINSGVAAVDSAVNAVISDTLAPVPHSAVSPMESVISVLSYIWLAGIFAMIAYALISYIRLSRRVRVSIRHDGGFYLCDNISTPFILGIIKPRIYIPSDMKNEKMHYVLSHERAHLKRLDHLQKALGFALLSLHWFNPLCHIAYKLFCNDIELACDEKVISSMDLYGRKEYSQTLLACSIEKKKFTACPLAFGETDVKERIKNVLNYKKPKFWVILSAVVICIITAIFFLGDKKPTDDISESENPFISQYKTDPQLENAVSKAILEEHTVYAVCPAEGHIILDTEEKGNKTIAYCLTRYGGFDFENGYFAEVTGGLVPSVYTFEKDSNGEYVLTDTKTTNDGSDYAPSIKRIFPKRIVDRVLSVSDEDGKNMYEQMTVYAQEYLKANGVSGKIPAYGESYLDMPALTTQAVTINEPEESSSEASTSAEASTQKEVPTSALEKIPPPTQEKTSAPTRENEESKAASIVVKPSSKKESIKLSNASFREKYGFDVYSYGAESVQIKAGENYVDLASALANGSITPEALVEAAKKDAKEQLMYKDGGSELFISYDDGGSVLYPAEGYALLKMNKISGETDDGFIKDIYIGGTDLNINDIY